MNLARKTAFFVLLVSTVACHDSTSPQPLTERVFLLESVNAQPVPADLGGSTSIVWSTLTLDNVGGATTVKDMKSVFQNLSTENTFVLHQEYRIVGDSIEIGSFKPCPPAAECIGNTKGTISDTSMSLIVGYNSYPTNPIIYVYRLLP